MTQRLIKVVYKEDFLRTAAVALAVATAFLALNLLGSLFLVPEEVSLLPDRVSLPVSETVTGNPGYYLTLDSATRKGNPSQIKVSILANAFSSQLDPINSGEIVLRFDNTKLQAQDIIENGSLLYLNKSIDNQSGTITFDFTTTSGKDIFTQELVASISFQRQGEIDRPVEVYFDTENTKLGLENVAQVYTPIYVSTESTDPQGNYEIKTIGGNVVEIELLSSLSLATGSIIPPGKCTIYLSDWSSCNANGEQTRYAYDVSSCDPQVLTYYNPELLSRSCSHVSQPAAALKVNNIDSSIQPELNLLSTQIENGAELEIGINHTNVDYCYVTESVNKIDSAELDTTVLISPADQIINRAFSPEESGEIAAVTYTLNCSSHLGNVTKTMTVNFASDTDQEIEESLSLAASEDNVSVPGEYILNWDVSGYSTCYIDTNLAYLSTGQLPEVSSNITTPLQLAVGGEVGDGAIKVAINRLTYSSEVSYVHQLRCVDAQGGYVTSNEVEVALEPSFSPDLVIDVSDKNYEANNYDNYPTLVKYEVSWFNLNMNSCHLLVEPVLISETTNPTISIVGSSDLAVQDTGRKVVQITDIKGDWMVYNTLSCEKTVSGQKYVATESSRYFVTAQKYGTAPASYPSSYPQKEDPASYPDSYPSSYPASYTQDPSACTGEYSPVCGQDLLTYQNACEATKAGIPIAYEGVCTSTDDGDYSCEQVSTDSCQGGSCIVGEEANLCTGECTPLPACVYDDIPCAVDRITNWCAPIENRNPVVPGVEGDLACPADYDSNEVLDIVDFGEFALNYKKSLANCSLDIVGDDCYLDLRDFQIFGKYYEEELSCN